MSSFSGERSRLATADGYGGRRDVVEDEDEDVEDFEEEEIWSVMRDKQQGSPRKTKAKASSSSSSSSSCSVNLKLQATITIPKSKNGSFTESVASRVPPFQQSAPVHIPDWIYKKKKKGKSSELDNEKEEEEEEEDGEEMVPPHEWIARKLARSQISPFSVFEGRGRTLKGRDLRKVRNAILTRTGFIE